MSKSAYIQFAALALGRRAIFIFAGRALQTICPLANLPFGQFAL
jgi:hypothetical protein